MPLVVVAQEFLADGVEPGQAVGFGEREASVHLLPVGGGVEIVSFEEDVAETSGEEFGDGGFAGAGDTHDEEDHQSGRGVVEDGVMGRGGRVASRGVVGARRERSEMGI